MVNGFSSIKEMKFNNLDSLKSVQIILDEADMVLKDKSRKLEDSPIAGVVYAAIDLDAAAAAIFIPALILPLLPGLAIGAQVVKWGVLALGIHNKEKKLREAQVIIYKNAIAKQNAIIKALLEEANTDKNRIEYLSGLNVLLQAAIKDLQHDLDI